MQAGLLCIRHVQAELGPPPEDVVGVVRPFVREKVVDFRVSEAGAEVLAYDGSEISLKGGGGPTCLTRPLVRA